jgi:hypothetical protein
MEKVGIKTGADFVSIGLGSGKFIFYLVFILFKSRNLQGVTTIMFLH